MKSARKHELEEPVELGEVRLAPTVELAGLAELSSLSLHDQGARIDALVRIAASVQAEDRVREHIATLREETPAGDLPKRR
jgi:hypothetical protein